MQPTKIISALLLFSCWLNVHSIQAQTISTFAGTGRDGNTGDGGPATNATLGQCISLAIDDNGDVYIATDHTIRKVDKRGIISTVAGTGASGSSGDGGPATNATFANITGIAFAPDGKLYLADRFNNKVRVIDKKGIVNTYAGNGSYVSSGDGGLAVNATFAWPSNVHFDKNGYLYIVDEGGGHIRRVNENGIIKTVASYHVPCDMAFDNEGRMYVTEYYEKHVKRDNILYAGSGANGFTNGPAASATFGDLWGISTDDVGNLYIADQKNHAVRKVDKNGMVTTVAGNGSKGYTGDGGPASNATMNECNDLVVDKYGNLYIADMKNFVVRKVTYNKRKNKTATLMEIPKTVAETGDKVNIMLDVTQNILTIICTEKNNEVTMTDISGKEILSETFRQTTKVISLADYPAGMYYIKVNDNRTYLVIRQ